MLDNKYILITGASRGIGKATKDLLKSKGYQCLTPTRKELDLSDMNSVENYLGKISKLNIYGIVNCAGINILDKLDTLKDESIDKMLNINLKSTIKIIQSIAPRMKKNKNGKIVNVSSIWGIRSKEYRMMYSATKFALNGITKSLSRELGPYGILTNSIAPGYVNTEMTKNNLSEEELLRISEEIPLKRLAEPLEIAKLIVFLISEENTYINGEMIIIDGGFLA